MCCVKPKKRSTASLNILLSNGRFPVSIDLARQLKPAGHNVYAVDPMHYHVCKFPTPLGKVTRYPHHISTQWGTRGAYSVR